jgi:hypothetical protein
MPSVHREQPYSRRISSSAEWLPGQGPGTNTRVPEKPKERLAQTLCSLSGNFLASLPKLHGPRNSVTHAPISPRVQDEYKRLVMTESGCSLFLYSAKLRAKFPLDSCNRPAGSRNELTTRSFPFVAHHYDPISPNGHHAAGQRQFALTTHDKSRIRTNSLAKEKRASRFLPDARVYSSIYLVHLIKTAGNRAGRRSRGRSNLGPTSQIPSRPQHRRGRSSTDSCIRTERKGHSHALDTILDVGRDRLQNLLGRPAKRLADCEWCLL